MRVADRPLNSLDERPATESQAAESQAAAEIPGRTVSQGIYGSSELDTMFGRSINGLIRGKARYDNLFSPSLPLPSDKVIPKRTLA